ncbi:hypothetical protein WOLCODRAFT_135324 [Wolfiporia cocos MD-104 SS10]|uniref:Pre-rRNA-processing protein Ipi1 N-terminal domain-containing protein n=1 Tax=Wolfiporia cocos (strain MD-104) TaxID=742152 RepID=A0A2H3JCV7_WOLCO|nr:hypothetical protein WOLCODRAFT_135324 [Wolfiporia cocos MD-104 SS10]
MRRDAILGFRELLENHPQLIIPNLTALINSCVRVIADEDASVRKILLAFFGWLLHQVSPDDLLPHSPVLLLFTTSAQTHIFPEIRIDAIRFLDLFLDVIPDIVSEGWAQGGGAHGRRVLEGYLGILNAGTTFGEGGNTGPVQATSTASVVLSTGSKLVVLKSLSSFLRHALSFSDSSNHASTSSDPNPSIPSWFLSTSFASPDSFECFDKILWPVYHSAASPSMNLSQKWRPEIDPDDSSEDFAGHFDFATAFIGSGYSLHDVIDINLQNTGRVTGGASTESSFAAHLARTLQPTLVSTFLDCAPVVFAPGASPAETEMQMVLAVGEICRSLYGTILRETSEITSQQNKSIDDLRAMLGYFAPYFPFAVGGSIVAKRDIKIEQAFQDLNLIFCELTSFLVLASPSESTSTQARSRRGRTLRSTAAQHRAPSSAARFPPLQVSRVSAYVVQLLRGETPGGNSQASLPRPITPAAYSALLPTIWSLLNGSEAEEDSSAVLRVVVEHAIKASSTAAVKRATIEFIGRLVLLDGEAEYRGAFSAGRNSGEAKKLEEWLLHLPKTVWELGVGSLPTTETILRLLLRLFQRRSRLLRDEVLVSLRARLAPYFIITHPTRGRVLGPFAKIPPASGLRRLALDVAATVLDRSGVRDELAVAVDEAVRGTEDEGYWASIRSAV